MSRPTIRVEGLGKQYRLGHRVQLHESIREALANGARGLARAVFRPRGTRKLAETIWALRDVSFEVAPGEVVGIIGPNGAGKSTLLKVLSRITEPTTGYAEVRGRVGSLIEVGTGFHPDLTGRENTFLNGAILGMRHSEIRRKFDEIVAFAELERFIDTPVKHYSSGMYIRLAFAVAAHLEPEVLFVDEVLAVGDAAFQKKCLGRMSDVARQGRTVLFVSHNLLAIEALCGRALWLQLGRLVQDGEPRTVVSSYLRTTSSRATERTWHVPSEAPGTDRIRLYRVGIRAADGLGAEAINVHTSFRFEVEYWNGDSAAHVSISIALYDEKEMLLFDVGPPLVPDWRHRPSPTGLLKTVCHVPGNLLNDGRYRVALVLRRNDRPVIQLPDALQFDVQDSVEERDGWYDKWPGAIRPVFKWETSLSEPSGPEPKVSA